MKEKKIIAFTESEYALSVKDKVLKEFDVALDEKDLALLRGKNKQEQIQILTEKILTTTGKEQLTTEEAKTIQIAVQNQELVAQGGILKGLGGLIKNTALSIVNFLASPVGMLTTVVTFMTAIGVYSATAKTVDKELDRINEKQEEVNNQLNTASDELKTIQDRINELNNIGSPTLVEQNELKKLQIQKELLEKNIELLKEEIELKNQEAYNTAQLGIKQQFAKFFNENTGPNIHAFGGYSETTGTGEFDRWIQQKEKYEEKIAKGDELSKDEQSDYIKVKQNIDGFISKTNEYFTTAFQYAPDESTDEYKELISQWEQWNEYLMKYGEVTAMTTEGINTILKKRLDESNTILDEISDNATKTGLKSYLCTENN